MKIKLGFDKPKQRGLKPKTPNIMIFNPKSIKIIFLFMATTTSNTSCLNIYTKTQNLHTKNIQTNKKFI